jgi:hypothetical protein
MRAGMIRGILLASMLMTSPAAFADDSSSDARDGFLGTLQSSEGLLIRVPVNASGEELVSAAETRVYSGDAITSTSDYAAAFESAAEDSAVGVVTATDLQADSSTSGWYYGDSHYRSYSHYSMPGRWSQGYYRSYTPSYYSYGGYYPYYQPSWRTYTSYRYPQYGHYGHHGQRFYHYGRRW